MPSVSERLDRQSSKTLEKAVIKLFLITNIFNKIEHKLDSML